MSASEPTDTSGDENSGKEDLEVRSHWLEEDGSLRV